MSPQEHQDNDDERLLLEQARDRAGRLMDGVTSDLESLRAAGSEAAYFDGAALCEDLAEATRQLIAELGDAAAAAAAGQPHPNPTDESPRP